MPNDKHFMTLHMHTHSPIYMQQTVTHACTHKNSHAHTQTKSHTHSMHACAHKHTHIALIACIVITGKCVIFFI